MAVFKNLNIDILLDNLPGYVYWFDKNNIFLGCSAKQAKALGLKSRHEIVGKKISDFQNEENSKRIIEINNNVMQTGIPATVEEPSLMLDGKALQWLSEKVPLVDEDGCSVGLLGTSFDLSELKAKDIGSDRNTARINSQSEEAIVELTNTSEAAKKAAYITKVFLKNITESLPQYVFWKDINSIYLGCNKNFAQLVGLDSPNDIVGMTDEDLHWQSTGHTAKAFIKGDQDTISGHSLINHEEILALPNGKILTTLVSKLPIIDNGQVFGIVGYFTDITSLRLAEEREQVAIEEAALAKAKADMETQLSNVIMVYADAIAHNQRTPLAIIDSVANYFEKLLPMLLAIYEEAKDATRADGEKIISCPLLKPKQLAYLETGTGVTSLKNAVSVMNANIDSNLANLDLTLKASGGKLSAEDLIICHIYESLKSIPHNFAIKDEEAAKLHVDTSYNFYYRGGSLIMDQVFTNLLQNSLYQIRKNGVGEVFVNAEDGGDVNIVRFRDTAGGAPAEVIERLFDTHFTTKAEGNGVGLTYCKNMMETFGGSIICHSVYGDYIEFVLTFPKLKDSN